MARVDSLMEAAVADGVFPGGVLLVGDHNTPLFFKAYGYANIFSKREMKRDTVFDLASLTKPLATTLAIMKLIQTSKLKLDERLGSVLGPLQGTEKSDITIQQRLSHTSGLAAYRPFYRELSGMFIDKRRSALRDQLTKAPLECEVGHRVIYSDLGFMILSWVVESVSGKRLDIYLAEEIYQPLGLNKLFFVDLQAESAKDDFAATEQCPWRKRLIEGAVHDENAYVVGGIEGHAGLFGTAYDVYRLAAALLQVFNGTLSTKTSLFDRGLVCQFFTRQKAANRALGFDMPSPCQSSSGNYFSSRTVGHLGFTGTSFWMDLEHSIIVILLTNRIHPNRDNEKIKAFRPELHDAVMMQIIRVRTWNKGM